MSFRELVKVLDREYSIFRRMAAAGSNGLVACATCGTLHHWKDITLGHYVSRARISVRWDYRNTEPQCLKCNSFSGGEQFLMRQYLVKKYGEKEIHGMEQLALITKTETRESLIEKIADYRERNRELRKVVPQ
jgi:hypothetical protein